jgi:hypothetical protein
VGGALSGWVTAVLCRGHSSTLLCLGGTGHLPRLGPHLGFKVHLPHSCAPRWPWRWQCGDCACGSGRQLTALSRALHPSTPTLLASHRDLTVLVATTRAECPRAAVR